MKRIKSLLAVILCVAMIAMGSVAVFADTEASFDPGKYTYNVMINGKYVEFTDAAPENINGRIMVPFRAILEALGASVDWDQVTKTVKAVFGDITIDFVVGKSDINIDNNGTKSVKSMDVVPFINAANDRTYVSTRFVAESFGYKVGWDKENKTVIIIDINRLVNIDDNDFTIMNQCIKDTGLQAGTAYEETLKGTLAITILKTAIQEMAEGAEIADDIKMGVSMDGAAVVKDSEMSMDLKMGMDMGDLLSGSDPVTAAVAEMFKNIDVKCYMDAQSGDMYFKTSIDTLISQEATSDSWFKMNVYDIMKALGMDLKALVQKALPGNTLSVKDVVVMMAAANEESFTINTYSQLNSSIELIKEMLSDSAVKVEKNGNRTTYTINLSNISSLQGLGGKVVSVCENGNNSSVITLKGDVPGMGNLQMDMTTTTKKTSRSVEKVPAGAKIIDITNLLDTIK